MLKEWLELAERHYWILLPVKAIMEFPL